MADPADTADTTDTEERELTESEKFFSRLQDDLRNIPSDADAGDRIFEVLTAYLNDQSSGASPEQMQSLTERLEALHSMAKLMGMGGITARLLDRTKSAIIEGGVNRSNTLPEELTNVAGTMQLSQDLNRQITEIIQDPAIKGNAAVAQIEALFDDAAKKIPGFTDQDGNLNVAGDLFVKNFKDQLDTINLNETDASAVAAMVSNGMALEIDFRDTATHIKALQQPLQEMTDNAFKPYEKYKIYDDNGNYTGLQREPEIPEGTDPATAAAITREFEQDMRALESDMLALKADMREAVARVASDPNGLNLSGDALRQFTQEANLAIRNLEYDHLANPDYVAGRLTGITFNARADEIYNQYKGQPAVTASSGPVDSRRDSTARGAGMTNEELQAELDKKQIPTLEELQEEKAAEEAAEAEKEAEAEAADPYRDIPEAVRDEAARLNVDLADLEAYAGPQGPQLGDAGLYVQTKEFNALTHRLENIDWQSRLASESPATIIRSEVSTSLDELEDKIGELPEGNREAIFDIAEKYLDDLGLRDIKDPALFADENVMGVWDDFSRSLHNANPYSITGPSYNPSRFDPVVEGRVSSLLAPGMHNGPPDDKTWSASDVLPDGKVHTWTFGNDSANDYDINLAGEISAADIKSGQVTLSRVFGNSSLWNESCLDEIDGEDTTAGEGDMGYTGYIEISWKDAEGEMQQAIVSSNDLPEEVRESLTCDQPDLEKTYKALDPTPGISRVPEAGFIPDASAGP